MPTIVEYTDRKPPRNGYPQVIVSPSSPAACCLPSMEEIGAEEEEGRWVFRYKRCRVCGFSVRVILRYTPDPVFMKELREVVAKAFRRERYACDKSLVGSGA